MSADAISNRAKELIRNFQDTLSAGEDLFILSEDFALGLHLLLLRRYIQAGRPLDFEAEETIRLSPDDPVLRCLYSVTKEIAPNDLKYGAGRPSWSLRIQEESAIELRTVADKSPLYAKLGGGRGTSNIRRRLHKLGGQFTEQSRELNYESIVSLPLRVGNGRPER